MKMSNEKQNLVLVTGLLLWCAILMFSRMETLTEWMGVALLWNLLLATIPLFWAAAFKTALQRQRPFLATLYFALWLLFLPNAPYLLTDLVHLGENPPWFILAILLSCAGTGTLLGYISLTDVHSAVEQRFGLIAGWSTVAASLMLCGFGIYLGRFLRWNSWDALTHPFALFTSAAKQFVNTGPFPHPLPVTLVFGGGLLLGYVALRIMANSMRSDIRILSQ